jgi:pyruvate/2-oxoglutarate dehydrogenase complex dihydrolipoamide dehydrogenase (E3) component
MRVMIVGGGFIGGHLAGRLRAEGCAVTVAGRRGQISPVILPRRCRGLGRAVAGL